MMFRRQFVYLLAVSCQLSAVSFLLTGCASAPALKSSTEDSQTQALLSRAASQLQAPNAPKSLQVMDNAQVEWRPDRSMKITVRQIWAARSKPDRPLPPLATLNQESEDFSVQKLRLYPMDEKGGFGQPSDAEIQWVPPEPNLPPALSKITSARLPELNAGEALEVEYTLETKTTELLKSPQKIHPTEAEGSFAFRWNDYVPSMARQLTVKASQNVALYGKRLRIPKNMAVDEQKIGKDTLDRFSLEGPYDAVPLESFQPAVQDLAPLTAFTVDRSWEQALFNYRKRVKQPLDQDLAPVYDLVAEAAGNTGGATLDKVTQIKSFIHKKVQWVDTGLPVYLNPDRAVTEVLESGKGTSHDLAVLLGLALKSLKVPCQIYLYRQSTSGELLGDLPALSQFDGVLVAAQIGKDWVLMDPTESLAPPGQLPFTALGQEALGVLAPLQWKTLPEMTAKDHRKERDVVMEFLPNGTLRCKVHLQAFGSSELALRKFFRLTTDEKRREVVLKG